MVKKEEEAEEVIPSAKQLINSLRDIGYDFTSAVADVIDNSIEWGATAIDIKVAFNGVNSWVRIADNGKGMDKMQLKEAMRFGSSRTYNEDALGKFGLGLKTASLSQCRFIAVASRNKAKNKVEGYCWDLDYIEKRDKWEILPITDDQYKKVIFEPLESDEKTGTVVWWWKLDRLIGYKHPRGAVPSLLSKMCRELEVYLGMVFHRFLAGEVPKRKITISINGNIIKPWDPFARNEKTVVLPHSKLTIEYEGEIGDILIEPYVLPSQEEFSTLDAFNKASGPLGWNRQQGFYIYRASRLIQSGGWCRLRTADEHTKLARIALSFSPALDGAFKLNIAKRQVQLPSEYRDYFDQVIQSVIKLANERYRGKGTAFPRSSNTTNKPTIGYSESQINQKITQIGEKVAYSQAENNSKNHEKLWALDEIEDAAMEVSTKKSEKVTIKRIFYRLRKKFNN